MAKIVPLYELITIVCLSVLALTFVVLRCVARFHATRHHYWDDTIIICAVLCSCAVTTFFGIKCHFGAGRSQTDLSEESAKLVRFYFFCAAICYASGITLTKISILVQYVRLVVEKSHKWMLWILIAFNAVFTFISYVWFLASCKPTSYFWDKTIDGVCRENTTSWYFNAACDILSDLWLCLFPILLLRSLHFPPRQKYALMFIFALGGA